MTGAGAPLLGPWVWVAQSVQDGLAGGVLAGMAALGAVSLLPRYHGHDG